MAVQADLKSSELIGIGAAAARFGMRTSALRYYEERGLLTATARPGGRRYYDRDQLRRLAFVQIGRRLGMTLDQLVQLLDGPEHRWRELVGEQVAALDAQIERASRARAALVHALDCPTARPTSQCQYFVAELDKLVDSHDEARTPVPAAAISPADGHSLPHPPL